MGIRWKNSVDQSRSYKVVAVLDLDMSLANTNDNAAVYFCGGENNVSRDDDREILRVSWRVDRCFNNPPSVGRNGDKFLVGAPQGEAAQLESDFGRGGNGRGLFEQSAVLSLGQMKVGGRADLERRREFVDRQGQKIQ